MERTDCVIRNNAPPVTRTGNSHTCFLLGWYANIIFATIPEKTLSFFPSSFQILPQDCDSVFVRVWLCFGGFGKQGHKVMMLHVVCRHEPNWTQPIECWISYSKRVTEGFGLTEKPLVCALLRHVDGSFRAPDFFTRLWSESYPLLPKGGFKPEFKGGPESFYSQTVFWGLCPLTSVGVPPRTRILCSADCHECKRLTIYDKH